MFLSSCWNNSINQEKTNSISTNTWKEVKAKNIKEMCDSVEKWENINSVAMKIWEWRRESDDGFKQVYSYWDDSSLESCRITFYEKKVIAKTYYNNYWK